jgi:hypothetical protein
MDEDSVSEPSAFFEIEESYEQAVDLGLRSRVPAQRKLAFNELGLGLRLSTGTQLEDEPEKKKKVAAPNQRQKWPNTHLDPSSSICMSSRKALLLDQALTRSKITKKQVKKTRSRQQTKTKSCPHLLLSICLPRRRAQYSQLRRNCGQRADRTSGLACSRHARRKVEWITTWTRRP